LFGSKELNHANHLLLVFRLREIDAVIITHSHADAIGGMQCWVSSFRLLISYASLLLCTL
jgi:glyoxylase-like metal-dependent hydrolase (beta-lactamase superfamily II)